MGEKYAMRSKTAVAKHKAKVALPLFLLLVLFVWNFPTLARFDAASSGPVDGFAAGEHQAQYLTVQYEGHQNFDGRIENDSLTNSQDESTSAQYDNLMSQIPNQNSHVETLSTDIIKENILDVDIKEEQTLGAGVTQDNTLGADIREEETRFEPTESNEEKIATVQLTVPASAALSAAQAPPAESEETRQQSEETPAAVFASPARAEEAPQTRINTSNVDMKTDDVPSGSEKPNRQGNEPDVDYSVITGNRSDKVNLALWGRWELVREVQLPHHTRKENFNNGDDESCEGRQVYVYDLPAEFNADLAASCDTLFPWFSMCKYFIESGRGVPVDAVENGTQIFVPGDRWFNTHQYSLELVSHARILKYKCRTFDPNRASLFYIPYYAGLDVVRWHFHPNATNEKRDELAFRLLRWLERQASWRKNGGRDHVLVLGKISWDFRRQGSAQWGSRLLELPEIQETTRLMIERSPWAINDIGVPHPTYFHPQSASDIDRWLGHVHSQWRRSLVTFVGKERKNDPTNVRTALVRQCRNSTDCRFVECNDHICLHAAFVTKAFLTTHFCMQPVGDSPTRRSVFDSLIAGCIPVLFHPCTAYVQYPWHLPANESSWSVYISEDEIRAGTVNVVEVLSKISREQRNAMRRNIINNVIPGLLYSAPGSDVSPYRDAFDITIDQLLYRAKNRLAETNPPAPPKNS